MVNYHHSVIFMIIQGEYVLIVTIFVALLQCCSIRIILSLKVISGQCGNGYTTIVAVLIAMNCLITYHLLGLQHDTFYTPDSHFLAFTGANYIKQNLLVYRYFSHKIVCFPCHCHTTDVLKKRPLLKRHACTPNQISPLANFSPSSVVLLSYLILFSLCELVWGQRLCHIAYTYTLMVAI